MAAADDVPDLDDWLKSLDIGSLQVDVPGDLDLKTKSVVLPDLPSLVRFVITIVQIQNIPKTDLISRSDPYVKIEVPGLASQATRVIRDIKTKLAVWNESFTFELLKQKDPIIVRIVLMDWDAISEDDEVAEVRITLNLDELTPTVHDALEMTKIRGGPIILAGPILLGIRFGPLESETDAALDHAPIPEPDSEPEPEPKPKPPSPPPPKATPEPEPVTAPQPEAELEVEPKPVPEPAHEAKPEPEPQPEGEPQRQLEPEPEPGPEEVLGGETEPEGESRPEKAAEPEPEPQQPSPVPEPETVAEPEPTAVAEASGMPVHVSVVEARGLPVLDCLVIVSISGQSARFRTQASGRTATPKWEETFTFDVADTASSTLSVQLIQCGDESPVGAVTFPLGDFQNDSFDGWLSLGGSADIHLVIERHAVERDANSDEEEEKAPADTADAPPSQTPRDDALDRFLRACGRDPAQVRAKAREDAVVRVEAHWTVLDRAGLGEKRYLLRFNRECLEWMERKREDPETMTPDQLRDRIREIELRIGAVEAEISELETPTGDQ